MDPDNDRARRIPRWGLVTARPHEFLVHVRRGEVVRGAQGGSCFKWPTDSVALVDTSLRRLQFTADQVTREKTGVQVTGLAVFRVVEPLIAYRMLDWSETHEDILCQMLIGATRRLVANLTLEDCLTRRKDALASELLTEIAPVVGGSGSPSDSARSGWGIALDTVEIQDVRVLSDEVFRNLQAPYREALQRTALQAKDEVRREEARMRQRAREEEERNRTIVMELEKERLVAERERALDAEAQRAEIERRKSDAEIALLQARTQAGIERAWSEAESTHQIALMRAESEVAVAQRQAVAERTLGEAKAHNERLLREASDGVSEERLRELLVMQLPEIAKAYAGSFDQIVVTGASDLSILGQGLSQVLATARALGITLPSARDDQGL